MAAGQTAAHRTAADHAAAYAGVDAPRRPLDLAGREEEAVGGVGGRSAPSSDGMPWLVGGLRSHGASAGC
jgi:hypothetical protein